VEPFLLGIQSTVVDANTNKIQITDMGVEQKDERQNNDEVMSIGLTYYYSTIGWLLGETTRLALHMLLVKSFKSKVIIIGNIKPFQHSLIEIRHNNRYAIFSRSNFK